MRKAEALTAECRDLTVLIALSYGGRDEIVRAVRRYAEALLSENENLGDLNEARFASYLDTAGIPDIDLVIRTGGNQRLSNFFPWQTTYSEIVFTDTLWPDFTKEELREILTYYENIKINKGK